MEKRKRKPGAGRPPAGPIKGKTANISTRVSAETRALLESEAREQRRSLSQLIELKLTHADRLEEVFTDFGGPEVFGLMQMLARLALEATTPAEKRWLDDPRLFDAVVEAWNIALAHMRPTGEPGAAPMFDAILRRFDGDQALAARAHVGGFLSQLFLAPDTRPLQGVGGKIYGEPALSLPTIKHRLGRALVGRMKQFDELPTAEQLTKGMGKRK